MTGPLGKASTGATGSSASTGPTGSGAMSGPTGIARGTGITAMSGTTGGTWNIRCIWRNRLWTCNWSAIRCILDRWRDRRRCYGKSSQERRFVQGHVVRNHWVCDWNRRLDLPLLFLGASFLKLIVRHVYMRLQ